MGGGVGLDPSPQVVRPPGAGGPAHPGEADAAQVRPAQVGAGHVAHRVQDAVERRGHRLELGERRVLGGEVVVLGEVDQKGLALDVEHHAEVADLRHLDLGAGGEARGRRTGGELVGEPRERPDAA
ncbi:hypothetical protein [Saccharothrix syringae]|uniref:Uncharacterized protein n=1 Tax=Saccharothrix syringae TaxID=103733 RepID=A0A5Q0H323_SACSY|nr:hypothetical protein [Saccharothrix syringae]QFZ20315.1 hypothetical protein EKG83_25430 [Saccharothrix syringae]